MLHIAIGTQRKHAYVSEVRHCGIPNKCTILVAAADMKKLKHKDVTLKHIYDCVKHSSFVGQ
jgi:hypothetical protein